MEYDYYSRVHKLSSSGEVLWTVSKQTDVSYYPDDVGFIDAPPSGGCVALVTNRETYGGSSVTDVTAFTSSGEAHWKIEDTFLRVRDITIGEDGAVYVLDYFGLHKVNIHGVIEWTNTDVGLA